MDLIFSLSLSPTGRERNSGNLVGAAWLIPLFCWRKRRKNPVFENSGEVRYSLWKFVLGTAAFAEVEVDEIGEKVEFVLLLNKSRFESILRNAIEWKGFRFRVVFGEAD